MKYIAIYDIKIEDCMSNSVVQGTMSGEIQDIEYFLSKSVSFDWKFSISGSAWEVSSKNFHLKEISTACLLNMKSTRCTYNNNCSYYNTVEMRITFANFHLMLKYIDLTITDVATEKKFSFHLKKNDLQPNVFSTDKNIYLEHNLFSQQSQHWKITVVYGIISRHESKIENDFKELLENEKHADFTIKTQNVSFKVHKAILSCRCDVLAKAIESDMVEKQKNEIQLDNWDPLVLKELITFIYTGFCEISPNPHHLFELAHYYQLDELKDDCSRYLKNNMNLKNIVHTLQLADVEQYKLQDLKILALSFVKNNENSLVKDMDFVDYLSKSIKIRSLVFILGLSYNYKLKGPLDCAKEFVKKNYVEVLENAECKNYLLSHADLLIDIFKYSLESQEKA